MLAKEPSAAEGGVEGLSSWILFSLATKVRQDVALLLVYDVFARYFPGVWIRVG